MKRLLTFITIAASLVAWSAYGHHQIPESVRVEAGSNGSGFIVKSNYKRSIVATNYHVCIANYHKVVEGNKQPKIPKHIRIKLKSGDTEYGKIVAYDHTTDLCLVEIKGFYPVLKLARSQEIVPGSILRAEAPLPYGRRRVVAVGPDRTSDKWARNHQNSYVGHTLKPEFCVTGMSGSAVTNSSKEVVGIIWGCTVEDPDEPLTFIRRSAYFTRVSSLKKLLKKLDLQPK